MKRVEVAVVGGGPVGLAVAIGAARRGIRTLVLERGRYPLDKACGEGLMPAGVAALEALGARALLDPEETSPIEGIRYAQEDGTTVEGRFPFGGGLAIRRTALTAALCQLARSVGVEVQESARLLRHTRMTGGVHLETVHGPVQAEILVAADGLGSEIRRFEGLELEDRSLRRYGLRVHFHAPHWTSYVEVHLAGGAEAYVTPCGRDRVGVAFLWQPEAEAAKVSADSLLERFHVLAQRLRQAPRASAPRGAGPLLRRSSRRVLDRLVLIGDAAGYVDAITGEGLSVGLEAAAVLAHTLPAALRCNGDRAAFRPYERAYDQLFRRYALTARALLFLARRPAVRRPLIRALSGHSPAFERLLRQIVQRPMSIAGA